MPSAAPVTAVPSSALALAFSFAIKRILRERVSRMPPGLIWMDGRRSTGLMPSHESAPARTRHRRCSAKTVKFPSFSQFGEISYLEALHVLLH